MKRMAHVEIIAAGLFALGLTCLSANPTGGQVAAGSAAINTVPGTVTVNQGSNIAIINWQTFSIGAGELTKFIQPSSTSAALNRVLGGQTSMINGTLSANGQVYLINGNGIVVGPGGMVNVNGFTASTRDISDSDFLSGNLHFSGSNASGVQNLGTINALGGNVYLIGKTVDNEGTINAANGTVGLASADDVVLNLGGEEHVFVSPSTMASAARSQTAVQNGGAITAASAELKAANGNLYALAINNGGTIRATAVSQQGGRIFLTTDTGTIQNSGTLSAKSGANGGQVNIMGGSVWNQQTIDASGAQGGSVTINSQNVQNDGAISAQGTAGAGGSVAVTYSGNALGDVNGVIDASGTTAGGSIQIEGTGTNSEAYLSLALNANSAAGAAGSIDIDTPTLYLTGGTLNANGATRGGRIFLGESDPESTPTLAFAQNVYVSTGTSISANATSSGNGGKIGIRAVNTPGFFGTAEALGAGSGSNGIIDIASNASASTGFHANVAFVTADTVNADFQLNVNGGSPAGSAGSAFEFVDPDPAAGNAFGTGLYNLTTNNTLITSPGDSFGGAGAGAAYLFSDSNGALLSTLRGSHAGDAIGTNVQLLYNGNGNFVLTESNWNGGMGAVTFGNGATGFAGGGGNVSASNSLVGTLGTDQVGSGGITTLNGGNVLVLSPNWGGGAGAVTWVSAASGLTGAIGSGNSLVGSVATDQVGSGGIQPLDNFANYLVLSPAWGGGAGAITNGSNAAGVVGAVSATNSLVGASPTDAVGIAGSVTDTFRGYYLVKTANWGGSVGAAGAGAVTWNSQSSGTVGVVSATNSLVGAASTDQIGSNGITELSDGNYLVVSPNFNGNAGAVTWGSETSGVTGVVSATNSLVGAGAGDMIGSGGIQQLDNEANYLVLSPLFGGGAGAITNGSNATGAVGVVGATNSLVGASITDAVGSAGSITDTFDGYYLVRTANWGGSVGAAGAGAVTWNSESGGTTGVVSATNSLVGAAANDTIGSGGITVLSDGNYVVLSPNWTGGTGAVTWGSGETGISGQVSATNSLVGTLTTDQVGSGGITTLYNGNFLVITPNWGGGPGAVTWVDESLGVTGAISASNSLVGTPSSTDHIGSGGIQQLDNFANYIVFSPGWGSGAGAITNGSDYSAVTGVVGPANSLVGASPTDAVGSEGSVTDTFNGYYLVTTTNWGGSISAPGAGAVTWNSQGNGTVGVISAANSLVGSAGSDAIGSGGITFLSNGNYVVSSPNWTGGTGAVTWGSASAGVSGQVSATNSLVGAQTTDQVGSGGIQQLENGANYLVLSPLWGGGEGAVTNGSSATGVVGVVGAGNSLVGASNTDAVGSSGSILDESFNGYYLVTTPNWGGSIDAEGAGAVTWNNASSGTVGVVSTANSLVGAASADQIGVSGENNSGITILSNGNYVVNSPNWNNGVGAVTWGSASAGVSGQVGAANSLVGTLNTDEIGSNGLETLADGNFVVLSPSWGNNTGAVTWVNGATGLIGVVGAGNSLVGASTNDEIGSSGITHLDDGNYLVNSPQFNSDAGAVTWGNEATGIVGVVGATNSLVGAATGDSIGNGGIQQLLNFANYLVLSPSWGGGKGAITNGSDATGVVGVVGASNSLVGAAITDAVGSGETVTSTYYGYYLVNTYNWGGGEGAVTWNSDTSGTVGVVSASNSLVGAAAGDNVGSGGFTYLSDGNFLVHSLQFNGDAGAITWGSATSGIAGVVSATNSLVGAAAGDNIGSGGIITLPNHNYLVMSPSYASSAGAATWGSETSGVAGVVGPSNSIVGGGPNSGEQFAGYSADGSIYLIRFATDTSLGGDGRVLAGSVNGPSSTPTSPLNGLTTQPGVTFSVTGLSLPAILSQAFVVDPGTLVLEPLTTVDSPTDSAINNGHGKKIASASSTSGAPGPQRMITPGNGIWNIFGGLVHSGPPPTFVLQQINLNLNAKVHLFLNQFLYVNP